MLPQRGSQLFSAIQSAHPGELRTPFDLLAAIVHILLSPNVPLPSGWNDKAPDVYVLPTTEEQGAEVRVVKLGRARAVVLSGRKDEEDLAVKIKTISVERYFDTTAFPLSPDNLQRAFVSTEKLADVVDFPSAESKAGQLVDELSGVLGLAPLDEAAIEAKDLAAASERGRLDDPAAALPSADERARPQPSDPLAQTPSSLEDPTNRGQYGAVPPPAHPLSIGSQDLDPLGGGSPAFARPFGGGGNPSFAPPPLFGGQPGMGGGMHPDRSFFASPHFGQPAGGGPQGQGGFNVPPGARFDPVGPTFGPGAGVGVSSPFGPGRGGGTPRRGGGGGGFPGTGDPDFDEMLPPGVRDSMFG